MSKSPRAAGLGAESLPAGRPAYLRTTRLRAHCWRFEASPPNEWQWEAFPAPRFRFDSVSGSARVRYAGFTARGAARERWDPDRRISDRDGDTWLAELTGDLQVVDLRREAVLDRLGLDDRINTARDAATWRACQVLGDRLREWLPEMDAIVYRSRTTPESSANLAWYSTTALNITSVTRVRHATSLLDRLVVADGFTIAFDW